MTPQFEVIGAAIQFSVLHLLDPVETLVAGPLVVAFGARGTMLLSGALIVVLAMAAAIAIAAALRRSFAP